MTLSFLPRDAVDTDLDRAGRAFVTHLADEGRSLDAIAYALGAARIELWERQRIEAAKRGSLVGMKLPEATA